MPSTEAQGPTAVGRVRQSSIVSDGDFPPGQSFQICRAPRFSVSNPRNEKTPALAGILCHRAGGLEPSTPGFWRSVQRTSRASGGYSPQCNEVAWDSLPALRFRQSSGRRRSHRTARDVGKARARAHEDRLHTQRSRTSSRRFSCLQDAHGAVSFQAKARPRLRQIDPRGERGRTSPPIPGVKAVRCWPSPEESRPAPLS